MIRSGGLCTRNIVLHFVPCPQWPMCCLVWCSDGSRQWWQLYGQCRLGRQPEPGGSDERRVLTVGISMNNPGGLIGREICLHSLQLP